MLQPEQVNAMARIKQACDATGETRSTFYSKAAAGLLTRRIKIGPRAAAVPVRELAAINAARIRGESDVQIKALVARLHAERAHIGTAQ